jgi:hypothetical protein
MEDNGTFETPLGLLSHSMLWENDFENITIVMGKGIFGCNGWRSWGMSAAEWTSSLMASSQVGVKQIILKANGTSLINRRYLMKVIDVEPRLGSGQDGSQNPVWVLEMPDDTALGWNNIFLDESECDWIMGGEL